MLLPTLSVIHHPTKVVSNYFFMISKRSLPFDHVTRAWCKASDMDKTVAAWNANYSLGEVRSFSPPSYRYEPALKPRDCFKVTTNVKVHKIRGVPGGCLGRLLQRNPCLALFLLSQTRTLRKLKSEKPRLLCSRDYFSVNRTDK